MTEQVVDNTPNEGEEHVYTAIEQEAMAQGWRPKEEYQGDPDRFIDAGEFVRRGELFGKIDSQNRELKQIKQALDQFKQHHANVEKVAYDRAIADLKKQQRAALREGDLDLHEELEDKREALIEEREEFVSKQARQETVPAGPAPEFVQWTKANPWYSTDIAMTATADRIGLELAKRRPDLSPADVLKEVEKQVKQEFKHKFENPNRQRAGAVESPVRSGAGAKSKFVPSEEQKRIGQSFVRSGAFAKVEDYYAELEKMEKGA